jgi:CheY-like chemotaxis protein
MAMWSWGHGRTDSRPITTRRERARVLIVDDEEAIRTFVERALRLSGYDTTMAANGLEALKIAEEQRPFDLLLADLVMPGMQGDELARRLRGRDPDLKVLYFTGYSDRLFADRTILWENEAFVEKPVSVKGLLEAISLALFGDTRHGLDRQSAETARGRSSRVRTRPVPVRLGDCVGQLVNVSATGALLRMPAPLVQGSEWSMVLESEPDPVAVRARVVWCGPLPLSLHGTRRGEKYAVAIAFADVPGEAQQGLKRLCGDAFDRRDYE